MAWLYRLICCYGESDKPNPGKWRWCSREQPFIHFSPYIHVLIHYWSLLSWTLTEHLLCTWAYSIPSPLSHVASIFASQLYLIGRDPFLRCYVRREIYTSVYKSAVLGIVCLEASHWFFFVHLLIDYSSMFVHQHLSPDLCSVLVLGILPGTGFSVYLSTDPSV
jgi:hypothetical protein